MKSRDVILEKEAEVAYFQAADSRDVTKLKEAAGIANATANEFMREGRFRDALKWAERDLTVALQLPPSELFSTWHTYGELYFRWGKLKKAGTYMVSCLSDVSCEILPHVMLLLRYIDSHMLPAPLPGVQYGILTDGCGAHMICLISEKASGPG